MSKLMKMCCASLTAALLAGTVMAQDPPRRGNFQPGQGRGGMMQGGMMGGAGIYAMLATNRDLQEELKITAEQKDKLAEVSREQMEKMRDLFQGGGFGRDMSEEARREMREKMEQMQSEIRKAYEDVLDADQVKRLKQINYQFMGVNAFTNKDVQEELKLSDDQKDKIQSIMESFRRDQRELMGGMRGGRGEGGRGEGGRPGGMSEENRKKMEALQKETEEKIATALTDEQRKIWKEMIGEKFDVSKLRVMPQRPRDN